MPRYIDADALTRHFYEIEYASMYYVEVVKRIIDEQPTISPDEVRGVGEWEDAKQHGLCRCSVCKDCYIEKDYITQAKWKYCPNCGARMKGVSEDANN